METGKNNRPREIHYADNKEIRRIIEKQWRKKLELEKKIGKEIIYLFFRYGSGHGTTPGAGIKDFRGTWSSALKRANVEFYEFVENKEVVRQPRILP